MTCIVGIMSGGRVHMGADSCGVSGFDLRIRKDPKVFLRGEFLFGFTDSFRMGQLLHYSFPPFNTPPGIDVDAFMHTEFIQSVRTCLNQGGYATKNNEREAGGEFLVGFRSRLFHVYADYQVGTMDSAYDACGCGEDYAIGSLYTTSSGLFTPAERILMALRTAEAHCAGVRAPFSIMHT